MALTLQPEFFAHAAEVRAGRLALDLARLYIRRDQGRRREAVAVYLDAAAREAPSRENGYINSAVRSVGMRAWSVNGSLEQGQPQRLLRQDVVDTIALAAVRVARRGAEPDCASRKGARIAADRVGDHCAEHAFRDRKARAFVEIDRMLFDALVPVVLGGEPKPRARRARRAA